MAATVNIVLLFRITILGVIAFQIALIFGASWGRLTQGGRVDGSLPGTGRDIAGCSVLILVAVTAAILSAIGHWPRWIAWVAVSVIFVSTVLNLITASAAERRLWAPVMTVMSIPSLLIVW